MSDSNLTVLSLNCRSIQSLEKRSKLLALIYKRSADIVIGCESHLDHTYLSSEVFARDFTIIRKDRVIDGGGVFVAFRNHLTLIEQPSPPGEAEMIWAKFQTNNKKLIYICSFYRPPNSDTAPLLHLKESILKINTHNSSNIILGGDFNYPDITWENGIGYIDTNPAYGEK